MKTDFTEVQLQDAATRRSNAILRSCVHCGFCTATCPTYRILGDECDSPRGRIYMIKNMLERGEPPDSKTVTHIDRCLSCLGCMTTCPSGVNYMHLVDHAREFIEDNFRRPVTDRIVRWFLRKILPYPSRFRLVLLLAQFGRPFRFLVPGRRLRDMMSLAPRKIPPVSRNDDPQVFPALGSSETAGRVMTGCAQRALDTDINDASIRFLRRHGCEVVIPGGSGCCGALEHHMGRVPTAGKRPPETSEAGSPNSRLEDSMRSSSTRPGAERRSRTTGTCLKAPNLPKTRPALPRWQRTYPNLSRNMTSCRRRPRGVAVCVSRTIRPVRSSTARESGTSRRPCSRPWDSRSANLRMRTCVAVQPDLQPVATGDFQKLRDLKVDALAATNPDVIAAGNVGCMVQIGSGLPVPVVHTVELLDWATGGPRPPKMADRAEVYPG